MGYHQGEYHQVGSRWHPLPQPTGYEASMAEGTASAIWSFSGAVWPGTANSGLDLDSTLVARCLSGEDAAWEELVRQHTRRVYGLCYRFTGRESDAQDLTQDVFLRVYRALS